MDWFWFMMGFIIGLVIFDDFLFAIMFAFLYGYIIFGESEDD